MAKNQQNRKKLLRKVTAELRNHKLPCSSNNSWLKLALKFFSVHFQTEKKINAVIKTFSDEVKLWEKISVICQSLADVIGG